ncbi:hypothetical protein Hanom_Chr13g01230541 [Helianthus anomalus]
MIFGLSSIIWVNILNKTKTTWLSAEKKKHYQTSLYTNDLRSMHIQGHVCTIAHTNSMSLKFTINHIP